MTNARVMDKRLKQLESRHDGPPIVILLCDKDETSVDRLTRWEMEHGPMGDRISLIVNFVDAKIAEDL